ncbi:MAG: EAL domain-containing protein [Pseudomonadota bacterium]
MPRFEDRNHFWALAGVGCVAVLGLVFGLLEFAQQSDLAAKQREQTVVSNGFAARISEVEALIVPNVVWDDAVRHLDNHFDLAWARDNIGNFFDSSGNFQFSLVLDAADRPIYGMRDGAEASPSQLEPVASAANLLLSNVRREEDALSRLHVAPDYGLHHPIQSSTPIWVDGRLFIVTATLVQSDFGHARITHARAPVVVTGRELDDAYLASMTDRYLLQNLHLHEGDSRPELHEAHAPIYDLARHDVATLDWTPQTPGTHLLGRVLPWMLGTVFVLLVATLALYARSRRQATQLAQREQRSLHMAYHDALTGISNRAHFEELLTDMSLLAKQSGRPYALHCIDLDRFKELNDTHGHQIGDELLKLVAERLNSLCGEHVVSARLGGDEFALLQNLEHGDSAAALAEAVVAQLSKPFDLSIGPKTLGCSVGTARSETEPCEPLEMLRRADMALYRAKSEGRNCCRLYNAEMDSVLTAMRRLKDDLRADMAAGGLSMVYQPQVRLSGEVVGLEALVRWTHAEQGPISPAIFVPLAEEGGLIKVLGEFTLRQAATDSLRWPHLKIAVNVSATQIQDPTFVERAKRIVEEAGASPRNIEIELTEGVFFGGEEETRTTLDALHEAGFSIALDDFGTGYSSLSYLQRFPIDKIKIDRSFVIALGQDPKADALFTAIVKLAGALDMRVIAEGVETNEQWLTLTRAGCPKIQGYIASRPLRAEDVQQFIDQAEPRNQGHGESNLASETVAA